MAGICEAGDEPSYFVTTWNFFNRLATIGS